MDSRLKEILSGVKYPDFEKDIVTFGFVKEAELHGDLAKVLVDIPSSSKELIEELESSIKEALKAKNIDSEVLIKHPELAQKDEQPAPKNLAPQIKNFVMISSGKGGVGKSTSSVNLAVALAMQGKKVGLLDADIYGPNIPRMMNLRGGKPEVVDNKLNPLVAYGVEVMSLGLVYEEGQSLIWRGPMIMRAIEQFLRDVAWSELDVLIIDMPPGTGDAQLSLAQSVPVTAGITVSTPQEVSLDDGRRSLDMFNKLNIPIAGVIENMSGFICPETQKEYDIFGKGSTKALCKEYGCDSLAEVPIEIDVRSGGDKGEPIVHQNPASLSAKEYLKAADKLWEFIVKVQDESLADNSKIQPTSGGKSACST
ncbi:MAG: Mrp/NBP35 family ATP-binding protein [Campylobacterales bacterium]